MIGRARNCKAREIFIPAFVETDAAPTYDAAAEREKILKQWEDEGKRCKAESSEAAAEISEAWLEYAALGGLFDGGAVFVAEWLACEAGPGVVVVDDGVGVAVIAFQASAGVTHPRVVHGAGEYAEGEQRSIVDKENFVAADDFFVQLADGDELAAFG